ncbi:uncharacterized protein LOC143857282 [Tasmannia lanceolata]|uniref:uncharacterized protein LOC143857282 n=1 Tax=Tasmannia lanceolata TaxID=3420 RepID=UPI004063E113
MRAFVLGFLFFFCFHFHRELSYALSERQMHASTPPRGWNSYDSYSWIISEEEFLRNAEIISMKLLPHGYEYVVVDFLWYRRKVEGAYTDSLGFDVIDEWGRMIPDPERWPSSRDGKGFKEVAKKVHGMGLKFGIHLMRGISTQAVNANTPILDTFKGGAFEESGQQWRARDIGLKEKACAWMPHGFMSVNTKLAAGRAFLRSLYQQYAEWDVDFVKNDCVFGDDLDINEISVVSEVLKDLNRPILYSLSPGTSVTPAIAKDVKGLVNMYRVTGDDWDSWGDVEAHFNVARDFAASDFIGAKGLQGKSWPDLDMLPLGWLTDPGSNQGPHRKSKLTVEEQRTQMTLWSMAKSPLIFGGDMTHIDDFTFNILTNPTILEINSFSRNNMEFPYVTSSKDLKGSNHILTQSTRNLKDSNVDEVVLTSCNDHKAKGWVVESHEQEMDRICWNDRLERNDESQFCLYKRNHLLTRDEEVIYKKQYQGKYHLLANKTTEHCLVASRNRKLTSQDSKGSSLFPCNWDANQMWELNPTGTLVNSYSGLCAIMRTVKDEGNSGGIRSWVAAGRRGEIYLAFFNLNPEKVEISANIADLAKVLPKKYLRKDSCSCTEVWTAKNFGTTKSKLSTAVETHGCALFVLECN